MNILLTNRCNRQCPYCFARERISFPDGNGLQEKAPACISRGDFRTALDFAKKSRLRSIGMLGGEPSLHPQFTDIMEEAWADRLQTRIFTNGMWSPEQVEAVAKAEHRHHRFINIILNLNEPHITSPRERQAQEHLLSRLGRYCSMSFNIYRTDFEPYFLVDLIKKYKTRPNIRLGISQPLAQMYNRHIDISDYRSLAPTLMRLARECDENDIRLGFDCGFTMCMFTAEEIGRLVLAGARFKASCNPAIDIGTDLATWACFPLSTFSKGALLSEFENIKALKRYFMRRLGRLYRTGALAGCVTCRHRRRKQCSGGCAAHVYRRLNP